MGSVCVFGTQRSLKSQEGRLSISQSRFFLEFPDTSQVNVYVLLLMGSSMLLDWFQCLD